MQWRPKTADNIGQQRKPLHLHSDERAVNTCLRLVFAKLGVPDRIPLASVVHHLIE